MSKGSLTDWSSHYVASALPDDTVHVWRASLELPASQQQALWRTLSADERARFERIRHERVRTHFLIARGILRMILGHYLQISPDQIVFDYNEHGKPFLVDACAGTGLCFNLSHSRDLALFAVTHHHEVGVDVEYHRPGSLEDRMRIARRFFSDEEYRVLTTLPAHRRQEAFFVCWTRKEAFIKAKGRGLSLPLSHFDVSLSPDEPAALLATRWDKTEAARWSLYGLHPGDGYSGAVAVEGRDVRVACWQWAGIEEMGR